MAHEKFLVTNRYGWVWKLSFHPALSSSRLTNIFFTTSVHLTLLSLPHPYLAVPLTWVCSTTQCKCSYGSLTCQLWRVLYLGSCFASLQSGWTLAWRRKAIHEMVRTVQSTSPVHARILFFLHAYLELPYQSWGQSYTAWFGLFWSALIIFFSGQSRF